VSLPSNYIARPYRGVSVQRWNGSLEPGKVSRQLVGREAYRRTEFIVLTSGDKTALVRIERESAETLFSPIVAVTWLAGPAECAYLKRPSVDTANATALAHAALAHRSKRKVYVIEGLFHHVNFIYEPKPVRITVVEVIPPEPPKLLEMARRVIRFDEDLPPIELVLETIDIRRLAEANPARRFLLPCRGSGIGLSAPVDYLDERPAEVSWTLIGCERSRQFFDWFYGHEPDRVELCPRKVSSAEGPTLLKCCLLERGLEYDGERVVVPWGASLKEVQTALHLMSTAPSEPAVAQVGPPQSRSGIIAT
jgi:hypothetical protein